MVPDQSTCVPRPMFSLSKVIFKLGLETVLVNGPPIGWYTFTPMGLRKSMRKQKLSSIIGVFWEIFNIIDWPKFGFAKLVTSNICIDKSFGLVDGSQMCGVIG